jgi:hypothetical protein
MPKRPPPPPVEMPSEIAVDDRGPTDVTFAFPHRTLGPIRIVGLVFIAVAGLLLYWVVRLGISNLTNLNRPLGPEDYVMTSVGVLLGSCAYFPLWLGLTILAGRRVVEVRGGKLRTTERVGIFWRAKRWPLDRFDRVQIVGFFPTPAPGPKEGTLLSRLDALTGVLADGTRFMIAPGYERRLLYPVADELARRCNARNDATARPPVVVTTLVPTDPIDKWNDDAAERPADSRAVVDEYPEGVTINVPPAGFRGAGARLLVVGVFLLGLMVGQIAWTWGVRGAPTQLFAGVGIVGALIATHGLRVARRRAVIAIVGPQLLILQTGLIRSRERKWDVNELAAVRVGKSGIEVNSEPVLELQIMPRTGLKFGLLAGRSVVEISWIAATLRRLLALPAHPAPAQ